MLNFNMLVLPAASFRLPAASLHFNHLIFNGVHHKTSRIFAVGFAKNIGTVFFNGSFADK